MNEPSEKVPLIKSIADASYSASKRMKPVLSKLRSVKEGMLPELIDWWAQASPEEVRDCRVTIAKRGWFPHPSLDMSIREKQIAQMVTKDPDGVDDMLMDRFREELDAIEKELVELYPRRSHLLHDAFDAHRRRQYSLAVLMFLTQADGIWYDEHSNSVFRAGERIGTYEGQNVPQDIRDIMSSHIGLLSRPLPIWLNEDEREEEVHGSSRHLIIHGVDVDYGTEKKSLQLISFLRWLSSFLESMKTKSKT